MVRELIIDPELEKCLPPLPEVQYQKLRASIEKKYDPAKPIVLWKERPNTIVDGHHRYKICQEFGIEPAVVVESFQTLDDAIVYALRRQVEQRNLSAAQLVVIQEQINDIEKMKVDADNARLSNLKNSVIETVPRTDSIKTTREVAKQIADKAGVDPSTVYGVHAVRKEGVPELNEMMISGEVGVKTAKQFVKHVPDKQKQSEIIHTGGIRAVKDVARQAQKEREDKKEADERRKFQEFNQRVAQKTAEAHHTIDLIMDAAGDGCLMPNMAELWCSDCRWGFDVFLPIPSEKSHCPYCEGENITKRESSWNPRLAITRKEL